MVDFKQSNLVNRSSVAAARSLTLLALGLWFAAASVAGGLGLTNQPGRPPLVLLGFIAVPILGFVVTYLASPSLRGFAQSISLRLLVGSHAWRLVGLGFIVAWRFDRLPAGFAVPEGLGDIIAAVGALLLLPKLKTGPIPRGWLMVWNTWGFIDLVSAITVGVLYSGSSIGILSPGTVTTTLMATFPVSLIPTFFVPVFLLLHVIVFKRIADLDRATAGALSEPPAHASRA